MYSANRRVDLFLNYFLATVKGMFFVLLKRQVGKLVLTSDRISLNKGSNHGALAKPPLATNRSVLVWTRTKDF